MPQSCWAAYIGDFGENRALNRLVYAYKYFKKVLFLDTQTGNVKVVDFQQKEIGSKDNIGTLGPDNVTVVWLLRIFYYFCTPEVAFYAAGGDYSKVIGAYSSVG